jgi:hypothetical protein
MRAEESRGMYVPAEQALHYSALGFEVVDDLTPHHVLVIPRELYPRSEARTR